MKKVLFMLSLGLLFWCSGCASTRQYVSFPDQGQRVEDPSKGRIYVFRPSMIGGAIPMNINDGEMSVGTTGPKGYLCWEREPGATWISGKAENRSELMLDVEANEVYYICQKVHMGLLFARNSLVQMDEVWAQERLLKCKPPTQE